MHALQLFLRPGGPGRCPFCHDDAPPPGAGKACPSCGVRLHDECHAALSRCPTAGCAMSVRTFQGVQTYLIDDRYQVIGRIGSERYGMAIHAFDRKHDRDVTLLYLEASAPAPQGEAILTRAIQGAPAVRRGVNLLGHGRDPRGARLFLVREFVPGGQTLAQVLQRRGALSRDEAVWLGRTLLDSLADLHARGLSYGELLGSESLLLERREERVHLRLANAGLRDAIQELRQATANRLATATRLGSAAVPQHLIWIPPEFLTERLESRAQDLWGVGMLLYRCLTGHDPWRFRDMRTLLQAYRVTPATPVGAHLPALDPRLAQAIDRALAHDPALRHPDAQAFLAALPPA